MLRPPRLADALLRATLPGGLRGETIRGDLLQEYEERAVEQRGPGLWLWFWVQAIELSSRYAWQRIRKDPAVAFRNGRSAHDAAVVVERKLSKEENMESFWTDLRYAVRMLVRTPTLSSVSVVTMGLGIGLVTFTFSVVYGAVLRPIPVRDAERFVSIVATIPEDGVDQMWLPRSDYVEFRDQSAVFEDLAAAYDGTVNIAWSGEAPQRFDGAFMTANGLSILGVPPHLGRTFQPGEDEPGAEGTIVLGYDVWRNYFDADESVVGTSVRVNGAATTIIGVMPPGFAFPWKQEVWVASTAAWEGLPRRQGQFFNAYGHLREGTTLEQATEEVQMIAARIADEFPEDNEGISARVLSYVHVYMPPEINNVLWSMFGATIGVMLIACANVANLLLARAALRTRDVAIRTAMGANRLRVMRQLMTEAMVLGSLGGLVGLVIALAGTDLFNAAVVHIDKPYWIDMRVDTAAMLFTFAATLLAATAAGTLPALRASGSDIGNVLRDESRGSSSLRIGRMSSTLVIGELAVSCMLLIAAGFMVRTVINAQQMGVGFDVDSLMTARVGIFETDYPAREDRQAFFRDTYQRLNDAAGVRSAALTTSLPSAGSGRWNFAVEGESYETDADLPWANSALISASYFETIGTELLAGREFRDSESFPAAEAAGDVEPVAIVNATFVDKFLGPGDPIGKRVRLGLLDSEEPWRRIVGVVPDLYVGADGAGGIGGDQTPPEQIFTPLSHLDVRFASLVMRADGPPESLAGAARAVMSSIDPNVPLYFVMPMSQVLEANSWAFSLFGSLFTIFGAAALFLAAVGLYGVMSFSVAQRRQEMGVRMALGAEAGDILRIVFRRVGLQLALGLTLGVLLGWALSGPLRFVMFGVETTDLMVYTTVVMTLVAASLVATFIPAHRASRVDPVTALRPD